MGESTKKMNPKKRPNYNTIVLKKLSMKYGITEYYIRQCLRKDRDSIMADTLQKEYATMCIEVQKALDAIQ